MADRKNKNVVRLEPGKGPAEGLRAEVAVAAPVPGLLSYAVPDGLEGISVGVAVRVPLGRRMVPGYVVRLERGPVGGLRPIQSVLTAADVVPSQVAELLVWAARYYCYPPGHALRLGTCGRVPVGRVRLEITELGRKALETAGRVLAAPGLELEPDEAAILARLAAAARPLTKAVVLRETAAPARVLDGLVRRGFVRRVQESHVAVRSRQETWVRPAREVDEDLIGTLSRRAPKMAALLRALRDAGGPLPLAALRNLDPGASARIRSLAAKGLVVLEEREAASQELVAAEQDRTLELNEDQHKVLGVLSEALDQGGFRPFLLHGVTGSGKTEIYLRLISRALSRGKTAIVLVPEIALTPQLAGRFHRRFGGQVAVLHSGLGEADRRRHWLAAQEGRVQIVVGARSAVFAPLENLGVIVVDEEHDGSYKQQEGLRYHARDLAVLRAHREGAVVVLGSATPSLESYWNAARGRYGLLELPRRATPRPLPEVEVVDLRRHTAAAGALTAVLRDALKEVLAAGEQAILFLNRRGYAPYLLCRQCGQAVTCPHCSVSLTWHKSLNAAVCHYCGHTVSTPSACPTCGAPDLVPVGLGTERLAKLLQEHFPGARVARLDRDTATYGKLHGILEDFRQHRVDLLVGTQMVTKGHDFPGVTLVGVVLADLTLNFPDFRAGERTFQLLSQVAGRAGRGERPGRVIVQTYRPEHHAVEAARRHDYRAFFETELRFRSRLGYPPVGHLAAVRFSGRSAEAVARAARELADWIRVESGGRIQVLGPVEAPLARIRDRVRWHMLLKCPRRAILQEFLEVLCPKVTGWKGKEVRVTLDVDPQDMM